jgi:hypothetical protein
MPARLRPITVDGMRFRWRFDERLVVVPEGRSSPQLRVEWGWVDWLEPDGPGPEPQVVTPRFVADAIRSALAQGWDPDQNGPPLLLAYEGGSFRVRRNDS